jgi:hypothetical protein
MNGETVDFIPMMPSHTAGDTIVRFRHANVLYIEDFYRNFGYPFADQGNGGSIRGMLDAVDLIERIAGPDTTLVPGHGTLVRKADLLGYRAMLVDILAKVHALRAQGKSLKEVLAANLTAPYDAATHGDTEVSKVRFITEVYDEVQGLPRVVDGKRTMPKHPCPPRAARGLRQLERDQLAGKPRAADGQHDVLLAVQHVRHRGPGLRRRHVDGANFLPGRLVVGAEHRTTCA